MACAGTEEVTLRLGMQELWGKKESQGGQDWNSHTRCLLQTGKAELVKWCEGLLEEQWPSGMATLG